jgi:hypothetical protein
MPGLKESPYGFTLFRGGLLFTKTYVKLYKLFPSKLDHF